MKRQLENDQVVMDGALDTYYGVSTELGKIASAIQDVKKL
jgi:hypothetical protein